MLNQLCMRLMDNIELLHFFFVASEEQFLIFSILVSFLHKEGHVGQLARDALLHCMSLSKKNDSVGNYIADKIKPKVGELCQRSGPLWPGRPTPPAQPPTGYTHGWLGRGSGMGQT